MISITNDLGFSSPHITHVIICEFLKFLYLNLLKIDIERREGDTSNTTSITINGKPCKAYHGL